MYNLKYIKSIKCWKKLIIFSNVSKTDIYNFYFKVKAVVIKMFIPTKIGNILA